MWSRPLPASGGHDPGQVGKPGQQRPDCTLQRRQLLSQATVPVLGTPAAANFLPRSPFVPQTPHTPLYSAPHTQGPLGVTTPPTASPSPNTPSAPPHLHFFPVTKPCGFSLPFLCLSPSPHTGPKDHHLPLDLPVERGWGRRKRAPLSTPGAEQALRTRAPAQVPHSPWREGVSLA